VGRQCSPDLLLEEPASGWSGAASGTGQGARGPYHHL